METVIFALGAGVRMADFHRQRKAGGNDDVFKKAAVDAYYPVRPDTGVFYFRSLGLLLQRISAIEYHVYPSDRLYWHPLGAYYPTDSYGG